jgi:hypothetical protein
MSCGGNCGGHTINRPKHEIKAQHAEKALDIAKEVVRHNANLMREWQSQTQNMILNLNGEITEEKINQVEKPYCDDISDIISKAQLIFDYLEKNSHSKLKK